ncbi:MAG: hypothetical protein IPF57_17735 [Gammaproteobacteria bacterium]|nr:hypothetical protein [Gammaproteobacteria bacterium]
MFYGQSVLNGYWARGLVHWGCAFGDQGISIEAALIADVAEDSSSRPGGDRYGWDAWVRWNRPLYRGRLALELQYARLEDSDAYSELLDSGSERVITHTAVYLEYRRPLRDNLDWVFGMSYQEQRSNLDLFSYESAVIETGIYYDFHDHARRGRQGRAERSCSVATPLWRSRGQ